MHTRLKAVWPVFAMILVAVLAWGGMTVPAASAATTGVISGTVTTDTGDPYDGVDPSTGAVDRVALLQRVTDDDGVWSWQPYTKGGSGALDANGAYSFTGLSTGDYTVLFAGTQDTYAFQYAGGASSLSDPKLQVLHVDGDQHTVDARLALGGRIAGSVVPSFAEDYSFSAFAQVYTPWPSSDGVITWKFLKYVNPAATRENPNFEVGGLAPGSYKMVFSGIGNMSGISTVYKAQWYRDKPTVDTANFITVTGTATTRLDQVRLSPAATLKGMLSLKDSGANAPDNTQVRVYKWTPTSTGGAWVHFGYAYVSKREWTLTNVPAGKYTFAFGMSGLPSSYLGAYYGGPDKNVYSLEEAVGVDVNDGEYISVDAALDRASRISGTVTAANGGAALNRVNVALYGYKKWDGDSTPSWKKEKTMESSITGGYNFTGLIPAHYKIGFEPDPDNGYRPQFYNSTAAGAPDLASALSIDLTTPATNITADAALVKGGTISGQVSNTAGSGPAAAVPVYLLASDGSPVSETVTNASGVYTFPAVKDGSYKVKYNREGINPFVSTYYKAGVSSGVGVDTLAEASAIVVSGASSTVSIDTKLKTGLTISGSAGTNNGNVKVQLYTLSGGSWTAFGNPVTTNASGAYVSNGLRKGTYRVGFSDGTSPARFSDLFYPDVSTVGEATDVAVDAASVAGISVAMVAGGSVSGAATPKAGVSLSGVRAQLYRPSGTGPSTSYRVVKTADVDATTGAYSFSGIVPGPYRIGFTDSARGYAPTFYSDTASTGASALSTASDVIIESAKERKDATVVLQTGAILGGTITHNSSSSKIVVDVFRKGGDLGMHSDWEAVRSLTVTPAEGTASTAYTLGGFASGEYKLRFSDLNGRLGTKFFGGGLSIEDELSKPVALTADGAQNYRKANITLNAAAKISGTIKGASGAGLSGIIVNAYRKNDAGWVLSPVQTTTSASGAYTLGGLTEGVFRLKFSEPANALSTEYYNNSPTLLEADDIVVADGETRSGIDATMNALPPAAKTTSTSVLQFFPPTAQQGTAPTALVQVSSAGSTTPTGTVSLMLDGKVVGTGKLNASGAASITAPADLGLGRHAFSAMYGGDDLYKSSTSAPVVLPVVPPAPGTHTTLKLSTGVLHAGESATATAWVDTLGGTKATGSVELQLTSPRHEVLATGTLADGTVTIALPPLVADNYSMKAVYKPTGSYATSSSDEQSLEVTGKAVSTTELELLDPAIIIGQSARAKITVSTASGLPVAGSVFVSTADGTVVGTGSIAASATSTTVDLTGLTAGKYPLTATFNGNNGLSASTSAAKNIEVLIAAHPVDVAFTTSAVKYGEQITAPVTVSRKDGASSTGISGTVQFYDEDKKALIGTAATVTNGAATLTMNSTALGAVGDHSLSVKYSGSGLIAGGASSAQTVKVNPGTLGGPTPTISGQIKVGSAATAVPGTWPAGTTLSYQWRLNGTAIAGATGSSYTIPAANAGGKLTVAVTGTAANYASETKVSAEQTVANGALDGPTPTITGTAAVDSTVTAVPGTWPAGTTLSYQWRLNGTAISGATGASYTIPAANAGGKLTVAVTGSLAGYDSATKLSAEQTVANGTLDGPAPTIAGQVAVGGTVTAKPGTWPAGTALSYQWRLNGAAISGATTSSYAIRPSDLGAKLTVAVTATLDGYTAATKVSDEQTVALGTLTGPTPTITGTVKVGSTVSASAGTWPEGVALSYQWRLDGTAITGATRASYTIPAADLDGRLTVAVTGTLDGYTPATKTSAEQTVAKGTIVGSVPEITGSVSVGSKVSVKAGTWTEAATLAYQWRLNGEAIPGATAADYTVLSADLGGKLTVSVTGTATGYTSDTKTSAEHTVTRGVVAAPTPEIEGDVTVGKTVSVKTGTWPAGATLEYQWRLNGDPIAGADEADYTIRAADAGGKLTVSVTGTVDGFDPATKTSAEHTVAKGALDGPIPTITGTVKVGATVTAVPGTWPAGTALSYQWRLNGDAVAGATTATYTIAESASGGKLSVAVTGALDGYESLTKTSAESAVADGGTLTVVKTPSISGTGKVGAALKVSTGTWNPAATTFGYQWVRDGVVIPGATKTGYTITAADAGKKIAVRVTARRAGFTDTPVTTATVAVGVAVKTAPKVSGTAKVGKKLKASKGIWSGGPTTYTYQWFRGTKKIAKATKSSYVITAKDKGKKLRVLVTAKRSGFPTGTAYSGYTKKVAR